MKSPRISRQQCMRLAIREARRNLSGLKGGPFGACLVRQGQVLAVTRNTVLNADATCHAEINAIRRASRLTGTHDLSGCEIFSTTEPCPMCFAAIHWARITTVYFGTCIRDVKKLGFNELAVSARVMKTRGRSPVRIIPGFLKQECQALLEDWARLPGRRVY